jgi:hypothetical protein
MRRILAVGKDPTMGDRLYLARITRVEDHWSLNVYGLAGANADLFSLDRVDEVVRDLIALILNVPTDAFNIAIEITDTAGRVEPS